MIVDGVDPRLPDQRAQTLDKGSWFKEQSASAVGPRSLQCQEDLAVLALLEAIECQRRASDVAAQPLQPISLVSANAYASVEVEAPEERTAPGQRRRPVAEHVELAEPSDGLVGSLSEHCPPRDRSPMEGMLLLVGTPPFFQQTASVKEAMDVAGDLPDERIRYVTRDLFDIQLP